jgi:L-threonylcarbamoyladenylate synthase
MSVIIFPTDTVYGIGTKIFDKDGIKRIYEIKNRPLDKPLACLCASLQQIKDIAIYTKIGHQIVRRI